MGSCGIRWIGGHLELAKEMNITEDTLKDFLLRNQDEIADMAIEKARDGDSSMIRLLFGALVDLRQEVNGKKNPLSHVQELAQNVLRDYVGTT